MEDGIHGQQAPVYNIKAISHLVGLLPVTLRAWERRYGLPLPRRGDQGYRLYSDYDLRTLRWIKAQIESGLSISRAVEYLSELRAAGKDPAVEMQFASPQPSLSTSAMATQFREALEVFNDIQAAELLRRAFTIYSVDAVLMEVIQPTLIALGEAWHRGEIPIAVEHFSTQFCMQHLHSLLATSATPNRNGLIIAACAPGETHQIGLLSLVVMLRWRGWDVKYFGPDLKLDRIEEALIPLRPKLLMFSATLPQNAQHLLDLPAILARFPNPKPLIVLGGQAFENTRLPEEIPAIYMQAPPTHVVATIETLMQAQR